MATNRALILVDIQPTFCEGGELAVTGGNQVARDTAALVRENYDEYDVIATTQDWHIDPGAHFSETPDFVDSWPPHGVAGSPNADLHPELAVALNDAIDGADITIRKGEYQAAYSGFDGQDENGQSLADLLRDRGITALDVAGIAESHCVKETVLDGLKAGFDVTVLANLTVPVSEELGAAARAEMTAAGAKTRTRR
jgi:nicotinamidase/pyrazinamidase